jgi:feruloyl-CoA synthase
LTADESGVSATEINIGGIFPFCGPASSIGLIGKGVSAYVQSINDQGGINGRKISYIAMDDAYSPPKAAGYGTTERRPPSPPRIGRLTRRVSWDFRRPGWN